MLIVPSAGRVRLQLTVPLAMTVEAGAIFSDDKAKNNPDTKMTGSWMFFQAENMEKAREWLENDICECARRA